MLPNAHLSYRAASSLQDFFLHSLHILHNVPVNKFWKSVNI